MSKASSESGRQLREVARLYTRAQRLAADCCGTTNTQCHILTELSRSGAQPLVDLGKRLCLEKSWVSRAVESLASQGLIAKRAHPTDARSWIVSLTAPGRRRVEKLNATLDEHAARLLESLPATDLAMVSDSLQRILVALRADAGFAACNAPLSCGSCEPKRGDSDE